MPILMKANNNRQLQQQLLSTKEQHHTLDAYVAMGGNGGNLPPKHPFLI